MRIIQITIFIIVFLILLFLIQKIDPYSYKVSRNIQSEMQKLDDILALQRDMVRELTTRMIPDDMQYVTVSAYNAVRSQTDSTPHITANNKRVRAGTCAISQDLLSRGWSFGDLVYVPSLNATFEIADTMNVRHQKSIDILVYSGDSKESRVHDFNEARKFGKLRNVQVFLLQRRGE